MLLLPKLIDSSTLLGIDSMISAIIGTLLFVRPSAAAMFFLIDDTDGVHWHVIRCLGGQILASSLVFRRFRKSAPETHSTCMMSRCMASMLTILLALHANTFHHKHFRASFIAVLLIVCTLTLVVYAYQLMQTRWPIGRALADRSGTGDFAGHCLFQLDSIISIVIGIAWMSFPDWLLRRQVSVQLNGSHLFIGRAMGALFCASHIISDHALYWKNDSDRRLAVDARAGLCIFILLAQIWSQIAYHEHWTGGHWVGISLFSVWTTMSIWYRLVKSP